MADERVTERVVERPPTTVVERRGSGWGVVFAIILIAIVAVAAYILLVDNQNETRETNAVVGAAQSVGDAAASVGAAGKDAPDGGAAHKLRSCLVFGSIHAGWAVC